MKFSSSLHRVLKKNNGFSLPNIIGLTLGIYTFSLLLLISKEEYSYDKFHKHSENICQVLIDKDCSQSFQKYIHGALVSSLEAQFPDIINSSRYAPIYPINKNVIKNGDISFVLSGSAVDSSFFTMFSFKFIDGDPISAFRDPNSVVITQKTSRLLFGEESCIGKTVDVEIFGSMVSLHVSSIIQDIPYNSTIQNDFFITTELMERFRPSFSRWNDISTMAYIQTNENLSIEDLDIKVRNHIADIMPESIYTVYLHPLEKNHLHNYGGGGNFIIVYIYLLVGLITLSISIINYINLSVSKYSRRVNEIRLRKIVGCSNWQLLLKFIGESVLIAAAAMILSLILLAISRPYINQLFDTHLSLQISLTRLLYVVLLILTIGIISGIYPSLKANRIGLLQRESSSIIVGAKRINLRSIMVFSQFLISLLLISSALIINSQLRYILNKDLGYNSKNIIDVEMSRSCRKHYLSIKDQLLKIPSIQYVSAANTSFTISEKSSTAEWKGKKAEDKTFFELHPVDYDYFEMFDLKIVDGRFFDDEIRTDHSSSLVINETAARAMNLTNPVGEWIECYWGNQLRKTEIIGIVQDFHFESFHKEIKPLFLAPVPWWYNELYIKVDPEEIENIEILENITNTIRAFVPDYGLNYSFLEDELAGIYSTEQKARLLLIIGAGMAILISCIGILALTSYESIRRRREMAIRKVYGASNGKIYFLMLSQSLVCVILANLFAWPLSLIIMNKWLQNFEYRINQTPWIYLLTIVISLGIVFISTSSKALKVIKELPSDSLREINS